MSLFDLLSYTDEEIELVTSALSCWLKTNHVDPSSERGRVALSKAILLVRSGVASPDDILAGLHRVGERPSASAFPAATMAERLVFKTAERPPRRADDDRGTTEPARNRRAASAELSTLPNRNIARASS